jgi:hypothetical protein
LGDSTKREGGLKMAFFEIAKEFIMNKPPNLKGPHFYKADSDLRAQLEQLKEFYKTAPDHIKPQVEQDIKMLHYGIAGEEKVAFELNNSYMPMIVLHDLHLEYGDLSAQIDFLVITNKVNIVLECKNLFGHLEVNDRGDFIRTFEYKGKLIKEGIYSPITQNARHLEMIKKIRLKTKNNFITRSGFLKYFDDIYKSVVVLANPKTCFLQ